MELVTKIPDSFLMEKSLTDEQIKILIDQINRFNKLNEIDIGTKGFKLSEDGKIILPEGTIIHGISSFSVEKVDGIAKTGIVTGQALGIPEDGETYYCADFHRIPKEETLDEFNSNFPYRDGRTPFGNGIRGGNTLAFIIEPRDEFSELLAYDCYREGTKESEITRSFVNEKGLPIDDKKIVSSILYGVPRKAFSGIVLGDTLFLKKEILELLIKLFPECYIASIHGDVIYMPGDNMENSILKGENYGLKVKLQRTQEQYEQELQRNRDFSTKTWELSEAIYTLINQDCSLEECARILLDNKLSQGTIEKVMEEINKKRNTSLKQ